MKRNVRIVPAVVLVVLVVLAATAAAAEGGAAAPSSGQCASPEHRQFDFWVGDWKVSDRAGAPQGTNDVTLEYGGCVVVEHWKGVRGMTGSSFNAYDASRKVWHQTWVDDRGGVILLEGGIVGGKMVLEGPARGPKGEATTNRISWEKLPDGRVLQLWTVSSDGGKTWTTSFEGFYAR